MSPPPAMDSDWAGQAACVGQPPRRFTDPTDHAETRAALAVCRRCPVRHSCLDVALARHPTADVGIWGGTTEPQRRHLRTHAHRHAPAAAGRDPRPTSPRPTDPEPARPGHPTMPPLILHCDEHGDLTDATGRVLIARLPTGRAHDYMVFIDGRPTTRTHRLADARQAAQAHLHPQAVSATPPSDARTRVASAVLR